MALRFEGAVLDGAAPPPPPGVLRVLGQTLSPGARLAFEASAERWRAESSAAPRGRWPRATPWARLLTPLPDAVADEATVLFALQAHLELPPARAQAPQASRESDALPEEAPETHAGVGACDIAAADDRVALRGQRGLWAREALDAGAVVGCVRARVLTQPEREAAGRPSLAEEAFTVEFERFSQLQAAAAAAAGVPAPPRLFACAHGCANTASLVNDGRACGGGARAARPNNCALLEVAVRGWPVLALFTLCPISQGEELLADYGDAFWQRFDDALLRAPPAAPLVAPVAAPGGGSGDGARGAAGTGTWDTASCGGEDSDGDAAPPAAPAGFGAGGHALRWLPFGAAVLSKAGSSSGSPDAVCPLAAHIAAPAAALPPWALRDALIITGLTKGAGAAEQVAPFIPRSWERLPVLLSPAADADAAAVKRFAVLCGKLASMDKAARVALAADGARVAYLLPPCAFADAQFAAAAAPAAQPVDGPRLCAFVLVPPQPQPLAPAPVAAPPPQLRSKHPSGFDDDDEALPASRPFSTHAPGFDDDDEIPDAPQLAAPAAAAPVPASAEQAAAALSQEQLAAAIGAHPGDKRAALQAAAAVALVNGDTARVDTLLDILRPHFRPHFSGDVSLEELLAALEAAPHRFELVSRHCFGLPVQAVYLLAPAGASGARVRVAHEFTLQAQAAAELRSAAPRGVLPLHALRQRIKPHGASAAHLHVEAAALRAALRAAPRRFELVPIFTDGAPDTLVFLLHDAADGGARVAPPPRLSAEEKAYAERLTSWLRKQGGWVLDETVVRCMPPPAAGHAMPVLHALCEKLRAEIGTSSGRRFLAALADGAPPAPPPDAAALRAAEQRETRKRQGTQQVAQLPPPAPPPAAAPVRAPGFDDEEEEDQAAGNDGWVEVPPGAVPPPPWQLLSTAADPPMTALQAAQLLLRQAAGGNALPAAPSAAERTPAGAAPEVAATHGAENEGPSPKRRRFTEG